MQYSKHVFPNGLRLITVPMADNPTVTVLVLVEAGSKYETKDINGLSHFLEHMCFKGTTKRKNAIDISLELDSLGSAYNAFTSQEFTGYYAKAKAEHLDNIFDVVSDIYLNQTFQADQIEREKGVIIEEINMYEDLPQSKVQDYFLELLYGDQPAGWDVAGPRENIRAMNRDHFVQYHKDHYVAEATTVVVSGKVTEDRAKQLVESAFAAISTSPKKEKLPVKEAQTAPAVYLKERKTDQTHLVIGFRTVKAEHEDQIILDGIHGVLGAGMSSRLFQKLREEMGVCYYVKSANSASTDHGNFEIRTGVDSTRLVQVVEMLLAEYAKLVTTPVSDAELKKVKDYLTGTLFLHLESSSDVGEYYGIQEIMRLPIRTPEEYAAKIQALTAADIQKIAKKYFVPEHLNLAVTGPHADPGPLQAALEGYSKLL